MAARKIAIANQKGGTAKTTTALSLAAALKKMGYRVLLVDTDPQGDLTKSMGWRTPDDLEVTISEHIVASITGRKLDSRKGILKHKEGMHLMPANIRLADVESALFMAIDRETVIKEWLSDLEKKYDYIIIDCMPTLGIIPVNVFVASDGVIIPVSAEYLPAVGMTQLLKTIERVRRRLNPGLGVEGILLTLFDGRTRLAREVEETIRRDFGKDFRIFDTRIPRAVAAAESSSTGESVLSYDAEGKVAQAYVKLAEEVASRE